MMPRGIAVDSASYVYVSDQESNSICIISGNNGSVSCLPRMGQAGSQYVPGFDGPYYLAVDASHNVYVVAS